MEKSKTNEEALNETTVKSDVPKSAVSAAELKKQKEQENAYKRQQQLMAKEEARQLAEYKRSLADSISLKRLQVEELELIVKYHDLRKKHAVIEEEVAQDQAKRKAEQLQREKEREPQPTDEASDAKVIPIKHGKPRSDEEIKESLEQ